MRQGPPLHLDQGCCSYVHSPSTMLFLFLPLFGHCGGAEASNSVWQYDINAAEKKKVHVPQHQCQSLLHILFFHIPTFPPPLSIRHFFGNVSLLRIPAISIQVFMHKLKMDTKTDQWKCLWDVPGHQQNISMLSNKRSAVLHCFRAQKLVPGHQPKQVH